MMPTGWCPGRRAGESEVAATRRQLAEYPGTQVVRKFFPAQLGGWVDALSELRPGMTAVVSYHGFGAPAEAFAAAIPPGVTVRLSPWHEPEKKTTPAQLLGEFRHLDAVVPRDHPLRAAGVLQFGPTMTVYRARVGVPADLRRFVTPELAALVDFVAWDWYPSNPAERTPTSPAGYEPPESAFRLILDFAAETGLPWAVSEINHEDIGGVSATAWYRSAFAYAKANGCQWWAHFHRGGGDLTNPASPRTEMAAALRDLIEQEATMGRWTDIAKWVGPTPNQGSAMRRHDGVVIHIAEGSYDGTIAWQRNPSADVSSHFIVAKDGRIAQMVDTNVTAWTQRDGNGEWLSIENEGRLPDALTAAQVEANARILAKAHQVYGVPLQVTDTPAKRGLGHHSMGAESGYDWGHPSCPGAAIKAQKAAIVARAKQIINGEDDDMQLTDTVKVINDDKVQHSSSTLTVEGILAQTNYYAILTRNLVLTHRAETGAMRAAIDGLAAALAKVTTGGSIDTAGVLAGIDERLTAVRADLRDAVADLGEGGAAQVRGPQS